MHIPDCPAYALKLLWLSVHCLCADASARVTFIHCGRGSDLTRLFTGYLLACACQVEYLKYSNMEQSTAARISGKEGSAELAIRYGIKTETLAFKLYHADNKHE